MEGGPYSRLRALESDEFPTTPTAAYENIMNRIERGGQWSRQLAFRTLSWLFYARSPLEFGEIREAVIVESGETELDQDTNYLDAGEIVKCCQSSVMYEKNSKLVRFGHDTVRTYIKKALESEGDLCIKRHMLSSTDIAKTCITYLGFREFERVCDNRESLNERMERNKFSRHAALYWGDYARGEAEKDEWIQNAIFETFGSVYKRESMLQITVQAGPGKYGSSVDGRSTGKSLLHIVAMNGLATLCRLLLAKNGNNTDAYVSFAPLTESRGVLTQQRNVDERDNDRATALHLAARNGATALHLAAENGYLELVQLLLENGANVGAWG